MNPSTALATVLVDELVRHGVRDAVLCPGSRSAPLAYALQEADRQGRLRLHVRVDERSAGFLALGLAKVSRNPVPVVTTSGTAVANLHPAVLEASHACVPLLALSADRPPELRGTGANQSTDQSHFFGMAVRWFHELGAPERRAGQNAAWRSVVSRACAAATGATGADPGPVHLNVPLREPLVPDIEVVGDSDWPESLLGRHHNAPWVDLTRSEPVAPALPPEPRTLVVIGDLPHPDMSGAAVAMAEAAGWPVVAEPFGTMNRAAVIPHGPLLLTAADWVADHRPARVLVVGRVTLSRAVAALLRDAEVRVEVVSPTVQWTDPAHQASTVHRWSVVAATTDSLGGSDQADRRWMTAWLDAGERVAKVAASVIEQSWPSGLAVASSLIAEMPSEATLFVGSSNAVRDLDLAVSPERTRSGVTVLANRGLAGIDGCVSTAVGVALCQPGRPAYALMGDLTFLHDSNGLQIGPAEPRPDLTIVVVNDDGGGIFTLLEPGGPSRGNDFERVFGTPTGTSLADLCRAHGVGHTLADTAQGFRAAVAARPSGLRVVEVRVDRSGHRELHRALRANAAAAVG